MSDDELLKRQRAAERALLHMGITFQVYSDTQGSEKIFPFDVIPRVIESAEWNRIERGLKQRIMALNLFIDDIYHDQRILKEGVIPREIIASALYVQNWALAADSVDYLAADNAPSAVQHYWTLSIEEQFYLVWPLLIIVATALAGRDD